MSATDQNGIKQSIRSFILGSVPLADLDGDANLFESGILNSLFAVQLMAFIERAFAIVVCQGDLELENFKALNAATAFVLQKTARRDA